MGDCIEDQTEVISLIHSMCPCRKTEIETLIELFGEKDELASPAIFVYGHTGTGKTRVLRTLMKSLRLLHVSINCIESHSAKLVFESILDTLVILCDAEPEKKCDSFNDFVRHLKHFSHTLNETFYIILEKAERLRGMDANLISGFLKLTELTKRNICVIFVTEIALEKFFVGTGFQVPCEVHFSDYSQQELVKIMSLDRPESYTEEFYTAYCQLVTSVFHPVCRDSTELKHLATLNFKKYCEPLGDSSDMDCGKLWRHIKPHFKMCLSTVYLREVSSHKWEQMQQQYAVEHEKPKAVLELPFFSKYLLIAAYLASHNPARSDRRYFCKQTSGKLSKRAKLSIKTSTSFGKLTGPKAFPLDRLMAIFFCIIEEKVLPNCSLLSQIGSLVSLNLIVKVSADDQIDVAKYKCLVDLEFIKSVARNVGFDLVQYLFEQ